MNSIKKRVIGNLLAIIILTIAVLDILAIEGLKNYYYKNNQTMLENQIDSSLNFYNKYFSTQTLLENIYDNIDSFWNNTNLQVEILDEDGNLLMDSYGVRNQSLLKTPDINIAMNGETAIWRGNVEKYKSEIMIVSKPIISNDSIVGIMRIISSLHEVEQTIRSFTILILIISSIVIIVAAIISVIMANNIVMPLNKIMVVANDMAKGNLSVRSSIKDTIEMEQLSNTLNFMATEIEKRDKLKNEFISSVSHELRTPLTSIKGWAVTLNDSDIDNNTMKVGLDIIEEEADRLTEMVEELLDFSKLINGVISLKQSSCDMKEFISYIEAYMIPRAQREGKKFEVTIEDELGNIILDKNRIKQVLINVIDNAFKFTDVGGSIKLKIKSKNKQLYFIIEDDGCGISKDELPRVKEKFYKGKNSRSRNGIGLSISDEIIRLHNGEIFIESEINRGTIIKIMIPIVVGE